ncbi:T9SS type A sorting domain-containing protein [Flavobacterium sp.]|uniref:T9SS type A sorting domain-containing protein n=1 Tax=Flavobacterium sp. TaxID=239 RepID=UPI0028BEB5F1|nr:T9SS type A sorting domain-containing protein [Flavobacterium sp.]
MNGKLLQSVLLLLFVGGYACTAQMYVSPNSYVYVNNEHVFVTSDLELNSATSNLFLRNDGQLLQGTTGSGVNKGVGDLSVYQEGTSNNFGYNYWCSPVGMPLAAAGNNTFGIGQLKRPNGVMGFGGQSIISSYDGSATNATLAISNKWIYKYITSNIYANWVYVGSANTINAGEGFTMKGVSGSDNTTILGVQNNPGNNQRYDFRGKPNDGTINIAVGSTAGPDYPNQTLTGNPYPSAINLNAFLLENSGWSINYTTGVVSAGGATNVINGNAYFWEHVKPATSHYLNQYIGGYGVYSPNGANIGTPGTYVSATWNTYNADGTPNTTGALTGSTYKRQFSPIGQGFMIRGIANGNAQMKNIYRVYKKEGAVNDSQFEKSANVSSSFTQDNQNWEDIPNVAGTDYTQISKRQVPQFKLHTVLNNQYTRETALAFNPIASNGLDNAFDGSTPDGNLPMDMYFPIDNKQCVISTQPFDIDARIPVAFKNNQQVTFRVTVAELINFDMSETIFMHDKQTGLYHDIKNNFFEVTLPAGNVQDRFEVTFRDATLSIDDSVISSLEVYQNNDAGLLTIKNPLQAELKSCEVFDVAGKQIFAKQQLGSDDTYEFSTSTLAEGVYIVRLNTNDNQQIGKKVIVKK